MNARNPSDETLFEAALHLPLEQRSAYLDQACGQDAPLRERLEVLLAAHEEAAAFMNEPVAPRAGSDGPLRIPLAERVGDKIGRYKLLQQIGEGGCGVVYMAEQEEPVRRRVALKVIKLGMDTKQVIARFEAERQALALMDHPNIARVLDAGATDTGRPFFVMELVRGIKITEYCDQNQLGTAQRLDLFIQVCQAVQHAHQKGIIHRDLKPSNILVTVNDAVPVPKVIDFGIAKATQGRLTDKTLVTAFEQFIGTPAYMSPEQAVMTSQDIDTRTDIYSLGVLLYELLTGKTPFDTEQLLAAGLDELRRTIREQQPERPSTRLTQELVAADSSPRQSSSGLAIPTEEEVNADSRRRLRLKEQISRVRGDLDWIVMKCLEKDRARRYETANGLARDIERHLHNEPVAARPPSRLYEFQKTVRRYWMELGAVAAVVVALSIGAVVSTLEAFRARRAEKEQIHLREASQTAQVREAKQRQRAEDGEHYAQRLLYAANMNLAQQAWEQNNSGRVRQLLEETSAYAERGFEWFHWQRQTHQEQKTLRGHYEKINRVAFSPDGRRIVTGSRDQTAKVWDAANGKEILTLNGSLQEIISVTFSQDGQRIATSSGDHTASVWDAASGKILLTLRGHSEQVDSVVYSPDGRWLATASSDGTAKVWDASSGKEFLILSGHKGKVGWVVFSPDGSRIATSSSDGTAKVWDAVNGKELLTLEGHRDAVNSVAFSPDAQRIVTSSNDRKVKIWNATTGKELLTLEGHRAAVNSAVFCPDGQRIVTGSDDWTAKLWDGMNGEELFTFKGHDADIPTIALSPDGRCLVTGSEDWTAKLWEMPDHLEGGLLKDHSGRPGILAAAFSFDGRRIVTGGADGTAKVWDATNGRQLLILRGHRSPVVSVAFSADSQLIITAGSEGTAKVWEAAGGKELLALRGNGATLFSVALSPDGKRLITVRGDHTAGIVDVASGKDVLRLEGHRGAILSAAFSPDGRRVVTGGDTQDANVWDATTGQQLLALEGRSGSGQVLAVAFSPDGLRIVTGHGDGTATVWDAAGEELLTLKRHSAFINALVFSPDNRRILSGSKDNTATLWDATSGEELLTLKGHTAPIRSVVFSPDGRRILTGDQDGTARLWETATADQVTAWRTEAITGGPNPLRYHYVRLSLETWQAGQSQDAQHLTSVRRVQDANKPEPVLQAQDPGMIKEWLLLAPIHYTGETGAMGLAEQQIPGEANLHPCAGQRIKLGTGDEGELVWTKLQLPTYLIDFNHAVCARGEWCAAYAVCYIQSDVHQTNLCIKVGSDDQSKVYLNGKQIYRCERDRSYIPDQDTITGVELKPGLNVLVFKVVNELDQWLASIRFTDASGHPLIGIHATFTPP